MGVRVLQGNVEKEECQRWIERECYRWREMGGEGEKVRLFEADGERRRDRKRKREY